MKAIKPKHPWAVVIFVVLLSPFLLLGMMVGLATTGFRAGILGAKQIIEAI